MGRYRRISIELEDHLWDLRCQGLLYSEINERTGVSLNGISNALRRRIRRSGGAVRFNRGNSFLSDSQIREIRDRVRRGETHASIAKDFSVTSANISQIARRVTYKDVADIAPRQHNPFANRLMAS